MTSDFIRDLIDEDNRTGKHGSRVLTRFPPEPNGYLHIGHAKSICLNFGIARDYGARCNLRFDDTNPVKEDTEYVDSIQHDVQWLGFSFGDTALYASDYFEEMYELAEQLVKDGKAYVDHSTDEEIKQLRGSLTEPGRPSKYRDRSVDENLALLREMRGGALPDGTCVLRAKIDLANPNMKMRDPLLYRIRHQHHHRTGDAWCIYPMYDYAHPLSDAIEGITHSICTLEFENNRELYDWALEHTRVSERHGFVRPVQIEFARLSLDYTVMSKRKLLTLVKDGHVKGWDDPRMPTIVGMRRRGYSPEAIRAFCDLIGVAKTNSTVDLGKLEFCVRDDLNKTAPRVLGVVRPLRVTITSWADGEVAQLQTPEGRELPFARELLIERDDFAAEPPPGFQRLAPGRTVRLRHGYCITCEEVIEEAGEIVELRCKHLPDSLGVNPDGVKVHGVIHWVSAAHAVKAEVRLYDRLCRVPKPDEGGDFVANLDPDSLEVVTDARVEPSLATAAPGSRWQLERVGYFVVDIVDSKPGALVLNRIVTLRDGWAARAEASEPAAVAEKKEKSAKAKTRPPKRSGAEWRAEARTRDATLQARFDHYFDRLGIAPDAADLLTGDLATGALFEAAVAAGATAAGAARWIINELPRELGDREVDEVPLTGVALGALVAAVEAGRVTMPVAKEVLALLVATGGDPLAIIEARGLGQVSDEIAICAKIDEVLAGNADKVAAYKGGKTGLLGFFVGQVVKASQGKADPKVVQRLLTERLA